MRRAGAVLLLAAAACAAAEPWPFPPIPPELAEFARQAMARPCSGPRFGIEADRPRVLRPPTPEERVYLAIAWDTGLEVVCEHIAPVACEDEIFNARGFQLVLFRSRCYQGVAENTGDPAPCAKIVPISELIFDGSAWTPQRCIQSVTEGTAKRNWDVPLSADLAAVLARHGFSPDEIVAGCERHVEAELARLAAGGDEASALRETMARARNPAGVLEAHLFGDLSVAEDLRPHEHCRRFFRVAPAAEDSSLDDVVVTRRPPEEIAAEFDSHFYAIYRSLSRTPEFRARIVLPADH